MNTKKLTALLLSFMLILTTVLFASCQNDTETSSNNIEPSSIPESSDINNESSEEPSMIIDENAKLIWDPSFADTAFAGLGSADDIYNARLFLNGKASDNYSVDPSTGDVKLLFSGLENTRIINYADGYMLSVPGNDINTDFSLSTLRCKYTNETSMLTVTKESSNPYGNNERGWEIYLTEWLNRFIADLNFLSANNIMRTRQAKTYTDYLPGYTVMFYDMFIKLSKQIEKPYYNIAVVRKDGEYNTFFLFVMKSTDKQNDNFDAIIKSFSEITPVGEAIDTQGQYEITAPEYWNAETKAYYEKLMNQKTCDWGIFMRSMPSQLSSNTAAEREKLLAEYTRLSSSLDYTYDIMPTYMHIAWGDEKHYFPTDLANEFAGGNGFNGKPVLQFTYQFTTLNNYNLAGYTPMFDILRGSYDAYFHKLAQDIKAYGKPVLFRLNNEMNSDWVSYCGIVTLMDPDIFIMTWERLYNIFLEEGVDNCIWIFNPIAKSTPYSSWGEALNYMPDEKYVQALGLTSYEMGNALPLPSFKVLYTEVYNVNNSHFASCPWIISEFACGAGGEKLMDWSTGQYKDTTLRRHAAQQAIWVREMFDCFAKAGEPGYEFVSKIKGAVWFSVNDYTSINDVFYVINNLRLDEELVDTLANFREGLARTHTNE